jgi:ABC-type Fe3+ transport system substrate-binding protein
MQVAGDYINYSLTILDKAPHKDEAVKFTEFLLSAEGMVIFRKNGQDPIIPFSTEQPGKLPAELLKYLKN